MATTVVDHVYSTVSSMLKIAARSVESDIVTIGAQQADDADVERAPRAPAGRAHAARTREALARARGR